MSSEVASNTTNQTLRNEQENHTHARNCQQPKKHVVLSMPNLFKLYSNFRESGGITPEEISILPRMKYMKGVDRGLGGSVYECFKTVSNCPTTWESQQKLVLPAAKELDEENIPFPRQPQHQTPQKRGPGRPAGSKNGGLNQLFSPTKQIKNKQERTPSPPKVVAFVDPKKPNNRPYAPWTEINSLNKAQVPPFLTPKMNLYDSVPAIRETFKEIRSTKRDKAPDKALRALHKNPALVLSLGPPFEIANEDKEALLNREKYNLRGKEDYAITILPVTRKQDIPSHRILRKIYKNARVESYKIILTIQAYLNRKYLSNKYSRTFSITPFNRACRHLWPVRRNVKAVGPGQKHQRLPMIEDEPIIVTKNRDYLLDTMVTVYNDCYKSKVVYATSILNVLFEKPYEIDYLKLKQLFDESKEI